MTNEEPSSQLAEKRRADRHALEAPVRMRVATESLEGVSDNFSSVGIMFFTDEPLRVSVEVVGPDGPQIHEGRLVRVQRMSETNTGLAIEFD